MPLDEKADFVPIPYANDSLPSSPYSLPCSPYSATGLLHEYAEVKIPFHEQELSKRFGDYDRSETSGKISLVGIAATIVIGLVAVIIGIYIAVPRPNGMPGVVAVTITSTAAPEVLGLIMAAVIVLCVEAIGFVHSVTLRAALASESRLRFNNNLRLLTASRRNPWLNPNGTFCNLLMIVLVTVSYAAGAVTLLHFTVDGEWVATHIYAVPVLLLGFSMLIQAGIALAGLRVTKVLTWSPSAFDTTAAMLYQSQVTRVPNRCMCSLLHEGSLGNAQAPNDRQPSPWQAHKSVRKVVVLLWVLILACILWGGVTYRLHDIYSAYYPQKTYSNSFAFFPNSQSKAYMFGPGTNIGPQTLAPMWVLSMVTLMVVQGVLSIGLHCSELIVNIVRDEVAWRKATTKVGTKPMRNPLVGSLGSSLNVILIIAKSLLHWMFGFTLTFQSAPCGPNDEEVCPQLSMYIVQIWYLAIALFVFAIGMTIVANYRPKGPQPAAYGHIQTLANLIDEWSTVMWWGHKADGLPYCHAGTSDERLPPVKMDCVYAGAASGAHKRVD
ncbi:hypothetical protein BJ138DRAFT_5654 [Hygrophoropsis aurantiaca]|uniref:Uncharacterized protein n=1 Tax=Hygrophoropsis aurantiaca TaxID=72124 RepID=A0ACB8ATI9_9AGAM|nr:hypothetical protein BJ138DRAFT_5654 [Hygrophoropsis aurantiaca]